MAALGGAGVVRLEVLTDASFSEALRGAPVCPAGGTRAPIWHGASVRARCPWCRSRTTRARSRRCSTSTARPRRQGVAVAVGAGMAPGLSCLLAAWAASRLDEVTEVHVASLGHRRARLRAPPPRGSAGGRGRVARRCLGTQGGRVGPGAGVVPRASRELTATASTALTLCSSPGRSLRFGSPPPGRRHPAGTASPRGCPCCGPLTPRGRSAP